MSSEPGEKIQSAAARLRERQKHFPDFPAEK
jgi:hypothetical protein